MTFNVMYSNIISLTHTLGKINIDIFGKNICIFVHTFYILLIISILIMGLAFKWTVFGESIKITLQRLCLP